MIFFKNLTLDLISAIVLIFSIFLILGTTSTYAHTRSRSYSTWKWNPATDEIWIQVQISDREKTLLENRDLKSLLPQWVQAWSKEGRCPALPNSIRYVQSSKQGWTTLKWKVQCPIDHIHVDLFMDQIPGHVHLIGMMRTDNAWHMESAINASHREVHWPHQNQSQKLHFLPWLQLGIEHILSGIDHIVFLLSLIVIAWTFKEVLGSITGFTLGHSFSLIFATLGWIHARSQAIEALIGLSIAIVATENLILSEKDNNHRLSWLFFLILLGTGFYSKVLSPWGILGILLFVLGYFGLMHKSPLSWRIILSMVFGMIHGFGFASALESLQKSSHIAWPLFGFNLGVELGQLAIFFLIWPLLKGMQKYPNFRLWTLRLTSSIALTLGIYWYLSRSQIFY